MTTVHRLALALASLCLAHAASAAQCNAVSGERRLALLELYTSEGCDSCPPTDRWVSELHARGFGPDRLAILGFHVDYWDYIGWRDPYAQRRFSERQRALNARNGARTIYTPQLVLNGRDFRGRDALATRLAEFGKSAPQASIRLAVGTTPAHLEVSGAWSAIATGAQHGQGWLALYESRLASDVRAGENRGKRLHHDFVVRDIAGPLPAGAFAHAFILDARWKRADLGVAAFVQDARNGETLQALVLPVCG